MALQQGAREAVEAIGKAGRQASEGLLVLRESERLQQIGAGFCRAGACRDRLGYPCS